MVSSAPSPRVAIFIFLILAFGLSAIFYAFIIATQTASPVYVTGLVRLMSGSVWPCAFLHASQNLLMQQVFTPLTSETGITKYIAGDLGAAFVVVALIVAYIFWRKRGELPGGGTIPAGAALASLR